LVTTVRGKSKESGTEGGLTRAENAPTDKNAGRVQDELATQMEDDERYAVQLQDLLDQLKTAGVVR